MCCGIGICVTSICVVSICVVYDMEGLAMMRITVTIMDSVLCIEVGIALEAMFTILRLDHKKSNKSSSKHLK